MLLTLGQEAVLVTTDTNMITQMQDRSLELFETYGSPAVLVLLIVFIGYLASGWAAKSILGACSKAKLDLTLGKFIARMAK